MKRTKFARRTFLGVAFCAGSLGLSALAQEPRPREGLTEPVFRVGKNGGAADKKEEQKHPLDAALKVAYDGLESIRKNVRDYTATLVKRERIDGTLTEQEFMFCKIRNRKVENDTLTVPFAVYLKFLKPKNIEGREVIWVEGKNDGKLIAHEVPGIRNVIRAKLPTNGFLAMRGNRYPITEAGVETLIVRLIEKGERERDKRRGETEVQFYKNAKINDRVCTLLEVKHPVKREWFEFHIAQIFIDDELQVPLRYAAYSWPAAPGGKPVLEEEYTYMDMKLNVGLTDLDFDPDNKAYKYP
jgi:hypothetical protein